MQKQYGKTPDELRVLVEGFSWVLGEYPMNEILKAMREYVSDNPDIPAPSDIKKIIEVNMAKKPIVVTPDTVEKLLRMKKNGIPLMPSQEQILKDAGASA